MSDGNGKQKGKLVPVEIHIEALGTNVAVNSNAQDPKMVLQVLIMAMNVMIAQHEIKKPTNIIQEVPRIVPVGRI